MIVIRGDKRQNCDEDVCVLFTSQLKQRPSHDLPPSAAGGRVQL